MTKEEIEQLSDDDLHKLSLQKNRRGRYTKDANIAYVVRQERANVTSFIGDPCRRPSLYSDDYQYYGSVGWGNR